ncbi:MAG: hypothetical protein M1544_03900 [Candidatus Marsarchaeota archaeon]|nr:hypothetical protein [Candidatus Marsarchaeota archaeon]MCL5102471.1 hypothetical protein [Candidatus Marsarchaeota archaeon]
MKTKTTKENLVMARVLEGTPKAVVEFDQDEVKTIKSLAEGSSDALGVINEMLLHFGDKDYFLEVSDELLKNGFSGKKLVELYNDMEKDFEYILSYMENDKMSLLRRDYSYQ